jgi:hypothetical protein
MQVIGKACDQKNITFLGSNAHLQNVIAILHLSEFDDFIKGSLQ